MVPVKILGEVLQAAETRYFGEGVRTTRQRRAFGDLPEPLGFVRFARLAAWAVRGWRDPEGSQKVEAVMTS